MTDWTNNSPPFQELQFSAPTLTDEEDCVEVSLSNMGWFLHKARFSPAALAALMARDGKLTKDGSSMSDAVAYANKYGLVLYDDWPTKFPFTYEQYLQMPPQSVLDKAIKVNISFIPPNFDVSPLWTITGLGRAAHAVVQINQNQYFDSEPGGRIKPFLNPITYQTSLKFEILSPTPMVTYTFVHKTGTAEYGFLEITPFTEIYHRAIDEDDIKFMAKKFNVSVLNNDGTINFSLAKEINI